VHGLCSALPGAASSRLASAFPRSSHHGVRAVMITSGETGSQAHRPPAGHMSGCPSPRSSGPEPQLSTLGGSTAMIGSQWSRTSGRRGMRSRGVAEPQMAGSYEWRR
jgi:hypothetical protein